MRISAYIFIALGLLAIQAIATNHTNSTNTTTSDGTCTKGDDGPCESMGGCCAHMTSTYEGVSADLYACALESTF